MALGETWAAVFRIGTPICPEEYQLNKHPWDIEKCNSTSCMHPGEASGNVLYETISSLKNYKRRSASPLTFLFRLHKQKGEADDFHLIFELHLFHDLQL